MVRAKILVVGPPESGKSMIANFLGDATESGDGEYHPTQGVRIMEFDWDVGEDPKTGTPLRADVELWDCGGKKEFETCWPAFSKDVNGVLMIYNPDKGKQHLVELEKWYIYFVAQQKLDDSQCVLFAHHRPSAPEVSVEQPSSGPLSKVRCVSTDLEEEPDRIHEEFSNLVLSVVSHHRDTQDQEELRIVGRT